MWKLFLPIAAVLVVGAAAQRLGAHKAAGQDGDGDGGTSADGAGDASAYASRRPGDAIAPATAMGDDAEATTGAAEAAQQDEAAAYAPESGRSEYKEDDDYDYKGEQDYQDYDYRGDRGDEDDDADYHARRRRARKYPDEERDAARRPPPPKGDEVLEMETWWCASHPDSHACSRVGFHKLRDARARARTRRELRHAIGTRGEEAVAADRADIDAMHRAWCKEGGAGGALNVGHAACRAFMHSRNIADRHEL